MTQLYGSMTQHPARGESQTLSLEGGYEWVPTHGNQQLICTGTGL